jgi:hypothetical protein
MSELTTHPASAHLSVRMSPSKRLKRLRADMKVKLSQTEWRQVTAACERLRLNKTDLIRLALDDLFRGPRLQPPADDNRIAPTH